MSVEIRFVVIRNNEEVKIFMDKKSADEYDMMLDISNSISELLTESAINLNDNDKEILSVFLSQKKDELLVALQAKKAKVAPKKISKLTLKSDVEEECAA